MVRLATIEGPPLKELTDIGDRVGRQAQDNLPLVVPNEMVLYAG